MTGDIQQALQDLALIRRAVDQAQRPGARSANQAKLAFLGVLGVVASLLTAYELWGSTPMSGIMMASREDSEIGRLGLLQVLAAIPAFAMCIYFLAWRASAHEEKELRAFLAAHFSYLRNLGLVWDLFIRFVCVSIPVLAGHAEWVPPLCTLFVGDFIFQGKFFPLPLRVSLVLGVACASAAAAQVWLHSASLLWPLIAFLLASALSIAHLLLKGNQA